MMNPTPLILFLLCASSAADAATTIYRCGPGGREYSQRPCVEGTVVEGTDGRTAAQRAAAIRITEQEKRKAAELERERRAEEEKKKATTSAAAINGLARPAEEAASAPVRVTSKKKSTQAKDDKEKSKDFVALEPVVKKK